MKFEGVVQFRSSAHPNSGPPGEKEILQLNPQRSLAILQATGWTKLEPGSLNLTVDNAVVEGLLALEPCLIEDATTVRYPAAFQHIPNLRKAYHYYRCTVSGRSDTQDALVRRALVPVAGRVELFAQMNLTKLFQLKAGDRVVVETSKPN